MVIVTHHIENTYNHWVVYWQEEEKCEIKQLEN